MTARVKGLTVVFEEDLREDDAQVIIDAIGLIRGVAVVTTETVTSGDFFQRTRIKRDLAQKLWKFLEGA